jgi:hypothetical protein
VAGVAVAPAVPVTVQEAKLGVNDECSRRSQRGTKGRA